MKYLINLNRFFIDKSSIESKLKGHASNLKSLNFDKDNNRIFIEADSLDISAIKELEEVKEVIHISLGYKRFRGFFEFNSDIIDCFKNLDFEPKTFKVRVNFISKIPISAKSIIKRVNTLLKKEGLSFSEEKADLAVHIEFDKDNKNKRYLISMYELKPESKMEYRPDRLIVLCFPGSVIEISDFLRLSFVFKIPLVILSDKSSKFEFNLNKAKKMTKGIHYEKFPLVILETLPSGYVFIGFSKLASKNEKDLVLILKKKAKLAFVFGDEKFGLSQSIRSRMDIVIKLTQESQKPLRASQALSYVLGLEKGLIF